MPYLNSDEHSHTHIGWLIVILCLSTSRYQQISNNCTSTIKQIEDKGGRITAEFVETHYDNNLELQHVPIPDDKKEEIAAKLQQGISNERIIDDIRNICNDEGIKRNHLLEKKDLQNISSSFGIESARKHTNDQQSVHAWITEWEQSESNPVLFYKLQGHDYTEEDLNLTTDDFIVILQSPFQKTLAKKFAHKGVCCDATHGTTAYDFKLTTLLVMDEFGEGVPIAWCLSNHEDFTHMCMLFKMIKR